MSIDLKRLVPAGDVLIRDNICIKGNLFGAPDNARIEWAKKLNLPRIGETLFFAGCGYQFMRYAEAMLNTAKSLEKHGLNVEKVVGATRLFRKVGVDLTGLYSKVSAKSEDDIYSGALVSAVNVLHKLGVEVAYLYEEEPCCGSPLFYSGFEDDFAENAHKTYKLLKSKGVKKIISMVPACTNSLKNLYSNYIEGFDLHVEHFVETIAKELNRSKIELQLKERRKVTFHDPCQLVRYLGITKEPRDILERIKGLEFKETDWTYGLWATCCGGGGGLELIFPELSEAMAAKRLEELVATGASTIVTLCPGCMLQLKDAAKRYNPNVKVQDLTQILDEALEEA